MRRQKIKLRCWRTKTGKKRYIRLYNTWYAMIKRCRDKSHPWYRRYGERGVFVAEEWQDFLRFRNWAIKAGYRQGLTLERLDNDSGYSPDNCCWATWKEQAANRDNNKPSGPDHWNYKHGRYCKTR